jgi:hypothetical protein
LRFIFLVFVFVIIFVAFTAIIVALLTVRRGSANHYWDNGEEKM